MKLIESSAKIIPQDVGLEGIYKQIELAGRICYKSEDKICEGSAKKMVDFLVNRKHGSPLEHGTIYLKISHTSPVADKNYMKSMNTIMRYKRNKYSKVIDKTEDHFHHDVYITTNYRVLVENNWLDDLKYLCEPTDYHEKRYSVKIICSIGVSRELNRHRVNSICEQSTRYCNYSLDKFNNEISFVIPEWVKDHTNYFAETIDSLTGFRNDFVMDIPMVEAVSKHMICHSRAINSWVDSMKKAEDDYMYLLKVEELKPQEARGVLPLDVATEVIYTAFASDWKHFFELRTAPGAHPDARAIACPLEAEFKLKEFI